MTVRSTIKGKAQRSRAAPRRIVERDPLLQVTTRRIQLGGPKQFTAHLEMGIGKQLRIVQALGQAEHLLRDWPSVPEVAANEVRVSQSIKRLEMQGRVESCALAKLDRAPGGPLGVRRSKPSGRPEGRHQSDLEHELL